MRAGLASFLLFVEGRGGESAEGNPERMLIDTVSKL
jgi:hypothetical protein